MPIDAAMRLIVARADTFADQKAKAPEDHSWAFPGAAMMDAATAPAAPAARANTRPRRRRRRTAPTAPQYAGPAAALRPHCVIAALDDRRAPRPPPRWRRRRDPCASIAACRRTKPPAILKKVDIDGSTSNAQLPLDSPFRDETGRTVKAAATCSTTAGR